MLLFYWIDVPQNIPINKFITRWRRYTTFVNPPIPSVQTHHQIAKIYFLNLGILILLLPSQSIKECVYQINFILVIRCVEICN